MSSGIWDDPNYEWDDPRITWVGAIVSTPDVQPPRALYISWAEFEIENPVVTVPGDRYALIAFAELEVPDQYAPPEVENPALIATPGGGMYVPMGRYHDPHRLTVRPR